MGSADTAASARHGAAAAATGTPSRATVPSPQYDRRHCTPADLPSTVRGWRQRLGLLEMLSVLRHWVTPAKLLFADPCPACDGRSPIAAAIVSGKP